MQPDEIHGSPSTFWKAWDEYFASTTVEDFPAPSRIRDSRERDSRKRARREDSPVAPKCQMPERQTTTTLMDYFDMQGWTIQCQNCGSFFVDEDIPTTCGPLYITSPDGTRFAV